jgi:hypothetical protein
VNIFCEAVLSQLKLLLSSFSEYFNARICTGEFKVLAPRSVGREDICF